MQTFSIRLYKKMINTIAMKGRNDTSWGWIWRRGHFLGCCSMVSFFFLICFDNLTSQDLLLAFCSWFAPGRLKGTGTLETYQGWPHAKQVSYGLLYLSNPHFLWRGLEIIPEELPGLLQWWCLLRDLSTCLLFYDVWVLKQVNAFPIKEYNFPFIPIFPNPCNDL